MSLVLPLVSLASLAGAAYFRPRRSANGYQKDAPRVPREKLPAIMAVLSSEDPTDDELRAAIAEAELHGLAGARGVFAEALERRLVVQASPEHQQPGAPSPEPAAYDCGDDALLASLEQEVASRESESEAAPEPEAPKKQPRTRRTRTKKETPE